ncbi:MULTISPECIES: 16S rRNA (guanine(966)-N(2))-methyltransferase RsmD [Micrococcaceae]|uniref:16S rRNA (guanine(966)-N(2))-methyltransferase RsmD n=1 Tax=unclassified Kocuria TaxID=2649579 RepID=UPI001011539C|nr:MULTISPECIES: 16S rRNA (guanine(966)-N(2))-methyltransferase RsmD [unclassified Kocuria]
MSRIIAGVAGGSRLASVKGQNTRPTTDRVKEALFSRLETYDVVREAHVLDIFAGSGALGLEAASRGAAAVTLVDRDRAALEACTHNRRTLEKSGVPARIQVVSSSAATYLKRGEGPWDLVFVDPPYAMSEAELATLLEVMAPALAGDAVVVVERSTRSLEPEWGTSLRRFGHRTYGETSLWFAEPEA